MKRSSEVGAAVVMGLALASPSWAQQEKGECPMHAAHDAQKKAHAHRDGVDARHDEAAAVSHDASIHHFVLHPDGGRIQLEVTDAADVAARDRIRTHLVRVAREFARGQFDLPLFIHDRVPPGVETMRRKKAEIRYRYTANGKGGQIDITTANPEARDAIHAFLRFQIADHGTGDTGEVVTAR
jgi:hypothetical protein